WPPHRAAQAKAQPAISARQWSTGSPQRPTQSVGAHFGTMNHGFPAGEGTLCSEAMPVAHTTDDRADWPPAAEVEFGPRTVTFRGYPYAAATVYPEGVLMVDDIVELVEYFRPPTLRTVEGYFLLIPYSALRVAQAFSERHGIPVV